MPRKPTNTMAGECELKLSAKAEAFNLAAHGTEPAKLTARNLIQTAESDLRSKERNRLIRAEQAKPRISRSHLADEPMVPYAFGHIVEGASTVAGILKAAMDLRACMMSDGIKDQTEREAAWRKLPLSTFRVYRDADILAEAAQLASVSTEGIAA